MDFFEVVNRRRSVRRYTGAAVPAEVMNKALDAALLAPNSSNLQTWKFYWVSSTDKKKQLAEACLNQGAARTADQLLVVVASPDLWKKTSQAILQQPVAPTAATQFRQYYSKLVPFTYGWRMVAPIKWLIFNLIGLWKPIMRRPWSSRDIQEVSIKSACLGAENFMLAIAAQGFDTCPMEGFDESRVKRLLGLKCFERVVMVISVGERDPQGIWGERYRCPRDWFIHQV
ncbi:nitroreductase family protein [Bdellovibrio svalbardensis]|uniref:Nitroreductase family protein n=1 Tax=Bdellovibrio svalbardensis TaxID=2972972 RepID=A0ABT6DGJ2_9BACT|nr:nitroreductase family protein [Bdellovibrio svalbardensis]MDG0815962.1 nitroreductase family protein [Bdellovibrio svalbardensis]